MYLSHSCVEKKTQKCASSRQKSFIAGHKERTNTYLDDSLVLMDLRKVIFV